MFKLIDEVTVKAAVLVFVALVLVQVPFVWLWRQGAWLLSQFSTEDVDRGYID